MVEYSASGRDDHGQEFQDGAFNARGDVNHAGRLLDVFDLRGAGARTLYHSRKRG